MVWRDHIFWFQHMHEATRLHSCFERVYLVEGYLFSADVTCNLARNRPSKTSCYLL